MLLQDEQALPPGTALSKDGAGPLSVGRARLLACQVTFSPLNLPPQSLYSEATPFHFPQTFASWPLQLCLNLSSYFNVVARHPRPFLGMNWPLGSENNHFKKNSNKFNKRDVYQGTTFRFQRADVHDSGDGRQLRKSLNRVVWQGCGGAQVCTVQWGGKILWEARSLSSSLTRWDRSQCTYFCSATGLSSIKIRIPG